MTKRGMKYREKIAEIIKKNGTYNGRSLSFDYYVIQPDDLAKALIAAGIGEVSEWKRRAEVAEKAFLILWNECKGKLGWDVDCTMWYKKQAEKELAEEKKDENI